MPVECVRWKVATREVAKMLAIEERLRLYTNEHPAIFSLKKWLQINAGKHPAVFFSFYWLSRRDRTCIVTPETQLVIEGFPRSANAFAAVAFRQAQNEKVRVARSSHVPAQVIRAARWQIPTLVLIRKPKDAILSLVIRDPVSVDQALRHYVSFYKTVEKYRSAYVLGLFEEVTEDYGEVIRRVNEKFETTFSLFRHDEQNVNKVFARIDRNYIKRHGETYRETKVSRPYAVREEMKHEVGQDLENPKRRKLIAEAEAVYARLAS
jgi:hypothetical protein